jgi:hypothetical protein
MRIMLETYKATLHGNRIEWKGETPKVSSNITTDVFVTILDNKSLNIQQNGKKMAEILSELASLGGINAIDDASEWQREQRQDRKILERED